LQSPYIIELITRQHHTKFFDCGDEDLNLYVKRFATRNTERGFGKTYVAVVRGEKIIRGYYTISTGAVALSAMPSPSGMPKNIPLVHIGRLATDLSLQGQGLGSDLLIHALRTSIEVSNKVGAYAVEVYALNNRVRQFYLKYGFTPFSDDELHLFLTMKKIRELAL